MLSYAQNLEDVVLSRLRSIVPVGAYVDVGAGHPVLDNVTYALYCGGWRGINVEPMPREAQLLRERRPHDQTVEAACGQSPGVVTLFEAPAENRGATTARADLAERYAASGQVFAAFEADVVTLASLLDRYEPGTLHIVKIDVEGMEAEVIAGAELERTRPWVLLIEATTPNTQDDSSAEWEPQVIAAGYTATLFDGLNRFYVRNDLDEVAKLLSTPANVFDGWQRASDILTIESQQRELESHRGELESVEAELRRAQAEVQRLHDANERAHADAAKTVAAMERQFTSAELYAKSLESDRDRWRAEFDALQDRVIQLESELASYR